MSIRLVFFFRFNLGQFYDLDLIAIPDFVSGAMENWGLITFRETRLASSENHSAINTKLSVALTVAHEISHMWFGDLGIHFLFLSNVSIMRS